MNVDAVLEFSKSEKKLSFKPKKNNFITESFYYFLWSIQKLFDNFLRVLSEIILLSEIHFNFELNFFLLYNPAPERVLKLASIAKFERFFYFS